jgi:hypothetical protein
VADVVVFLTKPVQPLLVARIGFPLAHCPLQSPVHPFYLALCLWVADPAEQKPYPLAHKLDREFCDAERADAIPPRRSVIHQHSFGQTALAEGLLPRLSHSVHPGTP